MNKVIISKPVMGICYCQVCAENDSSNKEILKIANQDNPSGTTHGWTTVVRTKNDLEGLTDSSLPVTCENYKDRTHFILIC